MCAPKSSLAFLVALAALAALGRQGRAAPARHVRSVELADALNRTVCPIRVEIDEHADRVPRRIKMMKCAAEPSHWCRAHLPAHECCQRRHGDHLLECVEMHDSVLVYYKSSASTATYDVAVGCSCMVVHSSTAPAVPKGPT
ncbi:uncharacterized protein LOC123868147 [Maniola jurtina]|uniref:uncharacterized protein LOC123868147 n=1 Tax=Maniola jurtina TaxID=191418 RepID=UPI001E68BC0E|nr:uncharacterized protein LOC123868147 [Maniola jurtina]